MARGDPQRLAAALGSLSEDTACEMTFPTPCEDSLSHGALSTMPNMAVLFRISRHSQYAHHHLCKYIYSRRGKRKYKPCPLFSSGWLRGQRDDKVLGDMFKLRLMLYLPPHTEGLNSG